VKIEIFPRKNVIQGSAKTFSVPPKLGARSPPLQLSKHINQTMTISTRSISSAGIKRAIQKRQSPSTAGLPFQIRS